MPAVAIYSFSDLERMAATLYKAQMFKIKSPEQALGLMLIAQAEGLHPMHAFLRYYVTEDGRPSLKAEAALALFIERGGDCKWISEAHDREEQRARWICRGETKEIGFTMNEARAAGYVRDRTNWVKDPASQLRARAITRAIRMLDPAVLGGIRTTEELADIPPEPAPSWSASPPAAAQLAPALPPAAEPAPAAQAVTILPSPEAGIPGLFGAEEGPLVLDYLQKKLGWLKPGQGLGELSPGHEARIRKNLSPFLGEARKFWRANNPNQANGGN